MRAFQKLHVSAHLRGYVEQGGGHVCDQLALIVPLQLIKTIAPGPAAAQLLAHLVPVL